MDRILEEGDARRVISTLLAAPRLNVAVERAGFIPDDFTSMGCEVGAHAFFHEQDKLYT